VGETFSARLSAIFLPDAPIGSDTPVGSDTIERPVQLGSLWAERPAVIVFLRHYG
jgi:hypothetical protein